MYKVEQISESIYLKSFRIKNLIFQENFFNEVKILLSLEDHPNGDHQVEEIEEVSQ